MSVSVFHMTLICLTVSSGYFTHLGQVHTDPPTHTHTHAL